MKSFRTFLLLAVAALHLSLPSPARAAILQTDLQLTGTLNKIKSGGIMTVESGGALTVASGASVTFASGSTVTFGVPLSMANGGLGVALTDPNADKILFWDDSAGEFTWLTIGTNISITGTTINVASGGDFSSNTSTTVDGEVVVFSGTGGKTGKRYTATGLAKTTSGVMSAASAGTDYVAPGVLTSSGLTFAATSRLLGRTTAGAGAAEELTISNALDFLSTTRGSYIYRGVSGWTTIAPGTSGYVLTSNGLGADPTYQAPAGGGSGSITASGYTMNTAKLLGRTTASSGAVEEIAIGTGLSMSAGTLTASGSSGTKTLMRWTALDNQPPSSSYATFNTRNTIGVLEFDASSAESAVFVGIIPEGADFTTGIKVRIVWMGATATSGNVIWTSAFERGTTDLDTDDFATGIDSSASAASGTSGIVTITSIDHSGSQIDSAVAGDPFRLKITRKAADASDTMTGDAQLISVEIQQR
jgi:hypothetical protein